MAARNWIAAALLLAPLAGCGGGEEADNAFRAEFRAREVAGCVAAGRTSRHAGEVDFPQLCACTIDRYMAAKTAEELRNADRGDPAKRAATAQCLREQIMARMAATAGGAALNESVPAN